MKQLKLKIITPEKLIFEEMVDQVSLPTLLGEITILPNHIPLISEITSGDVVAFSKDEYIPMAIVGGFLEVKQDQLGITEVVVLADFAEHIKDIGEDAIAIAKAKAEELKKQTENKELIDYERFATELERSLTRIKIADKWKSRKYKKQI